MGGIEGHIIGLINTYFLALTPKPSLRSRGLGISVQGLVWGSGLEECRVRGLYRFKTIDEHVQ